MDGLTTQVWNADAMFIGVYKGVRYYSRKGTIICLFGWMPKAFPSIRSCRYNITRWLNS